MALDPAGRWLRAVMRRLDIRAAWRRQAGAARHALLRPAYLEEFVAEQRSQEIHLRVRLLAALFAMATLAFIPLDLILLRDAGLAALLPSRPITALAFAGVAILARRSDGPRQAQTALALLVGVALAFYAYAYAIISVVPDGAAGATIALQSGYVFLPFLIVVLPGLFPLTVLEALLMAAPAVVVQAALSGGTGLFEGATGLALLWVVFLLGLTATLSAVLQLNYLRASLLANARDSLTGAMTRSAGLAMLEKLVAGSTRQGQPLTLIYLDLDDFKSVNDVYGHAAGDAVLVRAGQGMAAALRASDVLIRLGGEEFAVVLPDTSAVAAEGCLARLSDQGLGRRPDGAAVTTSVGVAETRRDGADSQALLNAADARMYLAKKAGRNRWVGPQTDESGRPFIPLARPGDKAAGGG